MYGILPIDAIRRNSSRHWVEELLKSDSNKRDAKWSESIAVGDKGFVSEIKSRLGIKAIGRKVYENQENYELCESQTPFCR